MGRDDDVTHTIHTGISCQNFFHSTIIPPQRVPWKEFWAKLPVCTTLNGALVQVHPDLFFPHGKGRTCSLITAFFFNLLNCSCKVPSRHLFSAWSFSREIFLSAFMISVVLTIQLQLRHIIILQGWGRFFKVDGAHEELRFYTVVVEAVFSVHL